ncbi:hypothetical protein WME94_52140 [Sorangium sp. So ce429]
MTIRNRSSETTKTKAAGSGRARRRTRRRANESRELSQEMLREAVLELLRLAVEYETPHAPVDPHLGASGRAVRLSIGQLSRRDAVLQKVVRTLLAHRDDRQEVVKRVRTAQALREVADAVTERRRTWNAEQRKRRKAGQPGHELNRNEPFRRELAALVRYRFDWWGVSLKDETIAGIVDAAIPRSKVELADMDDGLLRRLANVVGHEVTRVGSETLERIAAALGGTTQGAGRVKRPEDARHALDDDPVGGSEILGYVVRLLVARGHPARVGHAVMKAWSDEAFAIRPRTDGAPPSSADPTASS